MDGTSATVVIVGKETKNSEYVDYEIEQSIKKGNGIVAVKADDSVTDDDVPDKIVEAGGEVMEWDSSEFGDAIERAASQRSKVGNAKVRGRVGKGCGR